MDVSGEAQGQAAGEQEQAEAGSINGVGRLIIMKNGLGSAKAKTKASGYAVPEAAFQFRVRFEHFTHQPEVTIAGEDVALSIYHLKRI
jgi:hypothetical protein